MGTDPTCALTAVSLWRVASLPRTEAQVHLLHPVAGFISAFLTAPVAACAISSSRSANHSTSGCSMWSHGGLPITASNPPLGLASCHPCHTPGKATCQCRKLSQSAIDRASLQIRAKSESALASLLDISPLASSTYASSGRLPSVCTSGYSNVACSLFSYRPSSIANRTGSPAAPSHPPSCPRRP